MANSKEKAFLKNVAEWAQDNLHMLYGEKYRGAHFQVHHCRGRKYKHNKVHIGEYFIIPVPFELHDVSSNHPLNVTHHKHKFTNEFGLQSQIFIDMCQMLDCELPPKEVLDSIGDTNA